MVALSKTLPIIVENPLRARTHNHRYSWGAKRRSNPPRQSNLRRQIYDGGDQSESCSRDPIGYLDGLLLYAYVSGRAVSSVDPFGLCQPGWDGEACFKVARVSVSGETFGDNKPPFVSGKKWWLQGAMYFRGTVDVFATFNDTVHCCCPEKDVSINVVARMRFQYDYVELATRFGMMYQIGYALYVPSAIKYALLGVNGLSYTDELMTAVSSELAARNVAGLLPAAICASGQNSIFLQVAVQKNGIKIGRAPESRTAGRRPARFDLTDYFNLDYCLNREPIEVVYPSTPLM